MRYVKMLGLAAVAAAALMAFVGASSASATVLTSPSGTKLPAGTVIKAVGEGTLTLTTAFKNIECKEGEEGGKKVAPEVEGKTTNSGGTEIKEGKEIDIPVSGNIETLVWGACNCEVKTLAKGTLSISVSGTGPNGTLTSNGGEVTSQCSTIFGNVHCIYKTSNTSLGTLTGSTTTKATATMDISSANIPRLTTDSLCAEKANWDASYKVTSPDFLDVSK